jgi:hypothetical protein
MSFDAECLKNSILLYVSKLQNVLKNMQTNLLYS